MGKTAEIVSEKISHFKVSRLREYYGYQVE